jgi:NADH dehydrogenase
MRTILTGATGFLGRHLAREMARRGMDFCALVRPTSDTADLRRLGVECRVGDLTDRSSLEKAFQGCEAAIHLAAAADVSDPATNKAVNVQGVRNLIEAARSAGTRRIVFLSSTCAGRKFRDAYGESKLAGERLFQAAPLDVTILRPTMIYGAGSKEFSTFVNAIRRLPVVPLIGPGTFHVQPAFVDDVLPAILNALERPQTAGKTYDIAGADRITFDGLALAIAGLLGRRRWIVHLPPALCLPAVRVLGKLLERPPVTLDQAMAFLQDTEVDIRPAQADLGFAPRPLTEGLRLALGSAE